MRWNEKLHQPSPEIGSERIVNDFLIIPMKLDGEWRWWERTSWVEKYKQGNYYMDCSDYWSPIRWVEK